MVDESGVSVGEIDASELAKFKEFKKFNDVGQKPIRLPIHAPLLLKLFKNECGEKEVGDFDKRLKAAVNKDPMELEESVNDDLYKFLDEIVTPAILDKCDVGSDMDLFNRLIEVFKYLGYCKTKERIDLERRKLKITKTSKVMDVCEQIERIIFANELLGIQDIKDDIISKIPIIIQGMDTTAESLILYIDQAMKDDPEINMTRAGRQKIYRTVNLRISKVQEKVNRGEPVKEVIYEDRINKIAYERNNKTDPKTTYRKKDASSGSKKNQLRSGNKTEY